MDPGLSDAGRHLAALGGDRSPGCHLFDDDNDNNDDNDDDNDDDNYDDNDNDNYQSTGVGEKPVRASAHPLCLHGVHLPNIIVVMVLVIVVVVIVLVIIVVIMGLVIVVVIMGLVIVVINL